MAASSILDQTGMNPVVIKHYTNPQQIITFTCPDGEDTTVSLSDQDGSFPLNLPKTYAYPNLPEIQRISELLRHPFLQPTLNEGKVSFTSLPPLDQKRWARYRITNLQNNPYTHIVYNQNGTISFSYYNTITTWNYVADTYVFNSFPVDNITAFAFLPNGQMILGNDKGKVFFPDQEGKVTSLQITKDISIITDIIIIDNNYCIITFHNRKTLVSIGKREVEKELGEVKIIQNLYYVSIPQNDEPPKEPEDEGNQKNVSIKSVFDDSVVFELQLDEYYPFFDILTDEALLFYDKKGNSIYWNFITKERIKLPTIERIHLYKKICIDNGIIFFHGRCFSFFRFSDLALTLHTLPEGSVRWEINTFIPLADGSIMAGSIGRGGRIHVLSQDFVELYNSLGTIDFDDEISSIRELTGGFVSLQYNNWIDNNRIEILRSSRLKDSKPALQKIEEILATLKYQPELITLYEELDKLYKELDEENNKEKRYQTAISGMRASVNQGYLYKARKFYELAKRLKPDNLEPVLMLLFYLQTTPAPKLKNRAQLDLYSLQGQLTPQLSPFYPTFQSLSENKCRKRLIVGEGTFEYTEALLEKHQTTHPKLAASIIATELLPPPDEATNERIKKLMSKGVEVFLGIDASQLSKQFKGKRFKRIHWNGPFGALGNYKENVQEFKKIILAFFHECSQLQRVGDRLHLSMHDDDRDQTNNLLVYGTASNHYRLIRKRPFDETRYPGYSLKITGKNEKHNASSARGSNKEFVFEKTDSFDEIIEEDDKTTEKNLEKAEKLINMRKKAYRIKTDESLSLRKSTFACSSDEDSSDYYETDSE